MNNPKLDPELRDQLLKRLIERAQDARDAFLTGDTAAGQYALHIVLEAARLLAPAGNRVDDPSNGQPTIYDASRP